MQEPTPNKKKRNETDKYKHVTLRTKHRQRRAQPHADNKATLPSGKSSQPLFKEEPQPTPTTNQNGKKRRSGELNLPPENRLPKQLRGSGMHAIKAIKPRPQVPGSEDSFWNKSISSSSTSIMTESKVYNPNAMRKTKPRTPVPGSEDSFWNKSISSSSTSIMTESKVYNPNAMRKTKPRTPVPGSEDSFWNKSISSNASIEKESKDYNPNAFRMTKRRPLAPGSKDSIWNKSFSSIDSTNSKKEQGNSEEKLQSHNDKLSSSMMPRFDNVRRKQSDTNAPKTAQKPHPSTPPGGPALLP